MGKTRKASTKKGCPKKESPEKKKRSPGPYALFVHDKKSLYRGSFEKFSKACSKEWRNMSPEAREKYRARAISLSGNASRNVPYLDFVSKTYRCLRGKNPDWSSAAVRDQIMRNYNKLKCKCKKMKR